MAEPGPTPRRLTIFISSPGDVIQERVRLEQSVERLAAEFAAHFELRTIRWEDLPLSAAEHFQQQIPRPSTTDIVVVILWWRLGTPLRSRVGWEHEWAGPMSGREVTGTEWEFEDALRGATESGRPFVLVYQKQGIPTFSSDEQIASYPAEKAQVDRFIARWFTDTASDTYVRAWRTFSGEVEFSDMVDEHLTLLLREQIGATPAGVTVEWTENPFRGLAVFDVEDAPIFFGRTRAQMQLRQLAVDRAASGKPWILVTGASGSGKSSLVRAGLLPDVSKPGLVPGVGDCRYVIIRPSDRDGDPVASLAAALIEPDALPELQIVPLVYDASTIAASLVGRQPAAGHQLIRQGMAAARADLSEHYRPLLVVVVDQLEELFRCEEEQQARFVSALDGLVAAPDVWIVATLRADFLSELERHDLSTRFDPAGRYMLAPPTEGELGQIINRPARAAGLTWGRDDDSDTTLDEILRIAARRDPTSLPLLGFVLEQLWHQRSAQGVLSYAAYQALGGLEGAIGARAEEVYQTLTPEAQEAVPRVLRRLATVAQSADAHPVADTVPLDVFGDKSPERAVVDAMLAPEARLLTSGEAGMVRVTHEAVLTHWPRAARQLASDRRDLQLVQRLRNLAQRMELVPAAEQDSLLLAPGLPLSEAVDLLDRRARELDAAVVDLIERSQHAHSERQAAALDAERAQRQQAEWRRLNAEQLERRATAEELFARAGQATQHAERVEDEVWRADRKEYATLLRDRAAQLRTQAEDSLAKAYGLHLDLLDHPGAPGGQSSPQPRNEVFSLEVLPAPEGECFLIHYGPQHDRRLLVVDGGIRPTYRRVLAPALQEVRRRTGRAHLALELVVVSQYTVHSVGGIAAMVEDHAKAGTAEVTIERLWFNDFQAILPLGEGSGAFKRSFKEDIRTDAASLGLRINDPFDYFVMPSDIGPAQVTLPGGLVITVVAPPSAQVREWYRRWVADQEDRGALASAPAAQLEGAVAEFASSPDLTLLRRPPVAYRPPDAASDRRLDRSVVNMSSIVLHLAYGDKSILLTSNSRADFIMSGLFDAWLLDPQRGLDVDIATLPHHGSAGNVTPAFFSQVRAPHYVVIPARRFKLPRREMFEMLAASPNVANAELHFGGHVDSTFRGETEATLREADPSGTLVAHVPEPGTSVVIDLLDPVPPTLQRSAPLRE